MGRIGCVEGTVTDDINDLLVQYGVGTATSRWVHVNLKSARAASDVEARAHCAARDFARVVSGYRWLCRRMPDSHAIVAYRNETFQFSIVSELVEDDDTNQAK